MQARYVGLEAAIEEMLAQPSEHVRAAGTLRIPVVWHVLSSAKTVKVTEANILKEMQWLNDWYSGKNANYALLSNDEFASIIATGADINIKFELAVKDPSGNAFNGIDYVDNAGAADACDAVNTFDTLKGGKSIRPILLPLTRGTGKNIWDSSLYYNINT